MRRKIFRPAIFVILSCILLGIATSSHGQGGGWIVCRELRITTAGVDLQLACGDSVTVTGELDWRKPLDPEAQGEVTVWLYENDSFLRTDDSLATATCNIESGESEGTCTFEFRVGCAPQVQQSCKFGGGYGQDDDTNETHDIFLRVDPQGCESSVKIARCLKENGSLAMIESSGTVGDSLETTSALNGNSTNVSILDLYIRYDDTVFDAPVALAADDLLAGFDSVLVDTATAGTVHLFARAQAPRFTSGDLLNLNFSIAGGADVGATYMEFDHLVSSVRDSAGTQLDVQMATVQMTVLPVETGPPIINPGAIEASTSGVVGNIGAITDDNIAIPDWVEVSLLYFDGGDYRSVLTGQAHGIVSADGSFGLMVPLVDGEFRLIARDGIGNSSTYDFEWAGPVPTGSNQSLIILSVLLIVSGIAFVLLRKRLSV